MIWWCLISWFLEHQVFPEPKEPDWINSCSHWNRSQYETIQALQPEQCLDRCEGPPTASLNLEDHMGNLHLHGGLQWLTTYNDETNHMSPILGIWYIDWLRISIVYANYNDDMMQWVYNATWFYIFIPTIMGNALIWNVKGYKWYKPLTERLMILDTVHSKSRHRAHCSAHHGEFGHVWRQRGSRRAPELSSSCPWQWLSDIAGNHSTWNGDTKLGWSLDGPNRSNLFGSKS